MSIPVAELLAILKRHSAPGMFIDPAIPHDKLDNAIGNFPIGLREKVYALIDGTIFGSCKRGLAITEKGLVWKNSWGTDTVGTRLSWNELAASGERIRVEDTRLYLGQGLVVELLAQYRAPKAARLLLDVADHLVNLGVGPTEAFVDEDGGETPTDEESATYSALVAIVGMFAKLARIDGAITRAQVNWLSSFFDTFAESSEDKSSAIELFNFLKDEDVSVIDHARVFTVFAQIENGAEIYEQLWAFATLDGRLSEGKAQALREIARIFGMGADAYAEKYTQFRHSTGHAGSGAGSRSSAHAGDVELQAHYAILGCTASASDEELRSAFKRKISAFHPDKLHAKGLADEFVEFATQQAQRINEAYDTLMQHRRRRSSAGC